MQCPDCGYMLSAFDKECPRCKAFQAQGKRPPTALKVATPTPASAPEQTPRSVAVAEVTPSGVPAPRIDPALIACVVCGNTAAQKVTSICEAGTWTTHSRGQFVGVGSDSQGRAVMFGGPTSSTSRGVTGLAARLMPPAPPFFRASFTGTVLVPLILYPIALVLDLFNAYVATLTIIAVSFLWFTVSRSETEAARLGRETWAANDAHWRSGMDIWSRLFYCSRCDHVYDPQTRDAAPPSALGNLLYAGVGPPALPLGQVRGELDYRSEGTFRAAMRAGVTGFVLLAILWVFTWSQWSQQAERVQQVERLRKPLNARYTAILPRAGELITQGQQAAAQAASSSDPASDGTRFQLSSDVEALQSDRDLVKQQLDDIGNATDEEAMRTQASTAAATIDDMGLKMEGISRGIGNLQAPTSPDTPSQPQAFVMRTKAGGGSPP